MRIVGLGPVLSSVLLGVTVAAAAPGDFDRGFGVAGVVRAPFQTPALGQAIALQPDGKVLAAGILHGGEVDIALVRFLPDGSLDAGFGSGGVATLAALGPYTRSILVQDDGKIVTVTSIVAPSAPGLVLARRDAHGVLEPTFGTGGVVSTPLPGAQAAATKAVLDDGKVVVGTSVGGDLLVLRYAGDGSLDGAFGAGGIATIDFPGLTATAAALVLDATGVVVLGAASDPGGTIYTALARLDDTGALDATFGSGGTIVHDIGAGAPPQTMVRLADGKLLASVGGYAGTPAQFTGVFFARFDAAGSLDPTFGAGGILADASEYVVTDLLRTPDGKVVGVGTTGYALIIERYDTDGNHDPSFANGGELETTLEGNLDYPEDAVIAPDGKIAVTGDEYAACEPMNCDDLYHQAAHSFVARFVGGTAPCASDADCGPCESCGATGSCAFGPRASCVGARPGGASLTIAVDPVNGDVDRYRIRLKWRGATPLGYDPLAADDVGMCVYFDDERVLRAVAPAGPPWKGKPGSFSYRDPSGASDGIARLQLTGVKAGVDAGGVNLAKAMHGPLDPRSAPLLSRTDMLVQVHGGNGQCLQATVSDFKRTYKAIGAGTSSVARMRGVGQ